MKEINKLERSKSETKKSKKKKPEGNKFKIKKVAIKQSEKLETLDFRDILIKILTEPPFLLAKSKKFFEEQVNKSILYLDEVLLYNEKVNIVAKMSKQELLENHLLDCLLGVSFFEPFQKVADIGSGGGFPGIPLAIFLPKVNFTLIESKQKKVNFLLEMKKKLNFENVKVICGNVNEVNEKFEAITCRAFANIQKIKKLTLKMITSKTQYLLFKGRKKVIDEEISQVKKIYPHQSFKIFPLVYNQKQQQNERHLVVFRSVKK